MDTALLFAAASAVTAGALAWRRHTRVRRCWHPSEVTTAWLRRVLAGRLARDGVRLCGWSVRPLGEVEGEGYKDGYGSESSIIELVVAPGARGCGGGGCGGGGGGTCAGTVAGAGTGSQQQQQQQQQGGGEGEGEGEGEPPRVFAKFCGRCVA